MSETAVPTPSRLVHLRSALDQFEAPPHRVDAWRAMKDLLGESVDDPTNRDHFEPGHYTASGLVLSPARDRLLLIRHKKLGLWLQPGGHIEDSDESFVTAAFREVLEETGVRARVVVDLFDIDVHQIPPLGGAPAHLHFDLRVLLVADSESLVGSDEVADWGWFDLDELALGTTLGGESDTDASVRRAAGELSRVFSSSLIEV